MSEPGENDLPISALQHLAFCPRQWGLIHLEQVWHENRLTAEGRLMHECVDLPGQSQRAEVRTTRGMWLRCNRLAITGRADVVEFRPEPYPVEYKRGKRKPNDCDEVQLCAQALCLEEMLCVEIPRGAFFYGDPRRRLEVLFTPELRSRTQSLVSTMHDLYRAGITPPAQPAPHCKSCSLVDHCLPDSTSTPKSAREWLDLQIRGLTKDYPNPDESF
jgi:CRISPR-associated exonuclease Cas4